MFLNLRTRSTNRSTEIHYKDEMLFQCMFSKSHFIILTLFSVLYIPWITWVSFILALYGHKEAIINKI